MWETLVEMMTLPFQKPEYLHILINPIPTHVLPIGVLALLLAMMLKSREAKLVALVIILLSSAAAFPVYEIGERAYDRVSAKADDDGTAWLDEHSRRAEQVVPAFYVVAVISLLALITTWKDAKAKNALTLLTLVGSLLLLGAGGYIAFAGGKVAHKEFRVSAPPPAPEDKGGERDGDKD